MMLITLAQARAQIRSDDTYDDADVIEAIEEVTSAILNYVDTRALVDSTGEIPENSAGMPDVDYPKDWNRACKIEVARYYRFRENDSDDHVDPQFGYGYPFGKTAIALLFPYRMPTVA